MKKTYTIILLITLLILLTGCEKEKVTEIIEVEPEYSIYKFKIPTGVYKTPINIEFNSVVDGKILEKGKEYDNNYKVTRGKYALIGNKEFNLEFEEKTYTYYALDSYKKKFGNKKVSYPNYVEYMKSSLRTEKEGKIIKEYKNATIEGIAYKQNEIGIIDINYDAYNPNASLRIYVIPIAKDSEIINKILESEELTNIIYSIKLSK